METRPTQHRMTQGISRRQLLQTGLAAGATLAAWPLYHPAASLGCRSGAAQARRHPARTRLGSAAL